MTLKIIDVLKEVHFVEWSIDDIFMTQSNLIYGHKQIIVPSLWVPFFVNHFANVLFFGGSKLIRIS